ncbi:MAG TPA: phosphoesterase, partial [Terriglobales bacterium]|nr:phosphoesterase [Terriglobales bacterium]
TGNGIAVYSFADGKITPERFLKIPLQPLAKGKQRGSIHKEAPEGMLAPYPAGIAVIKRDTGDQLLIADNLSDDVLLMDAANGNIIQRFDVNTGKYVPSAYPYAVAVDSNPPGSAWVSLWNTNRVAKLDLYKGTIDSWIELAPPSSSRDVVSHPTAMTIVHGVLFVTLSNSDKIAVIDTVHKKVLRYLSSQLPNQVLGGSYPNSLTASQDGKSLFVADSSADAVAVYSIETASIPFCRDSGCVGSLNPLCKKCKAGAWFKGSTSPTAFLPTEWYPTAVAVRGDDLLIATGKGTGSGPNNIPRKPDEPGYRKGYTYLPTLLKGSLARVNLKEVEPHLKQLTGEVLESNLMNGRTGTLPFKGGNPIKHVIYIIKENRTFDQVLGDLGAGNGDPKLTIFGADITPNQHALARQFGVLDNFYVSGDVSGNGHVWSNAAITSDYTEKTWQISYRGWERTYDYEGQVGEDFPIQLGIPDVNEPGTGYLWTNLARHKKTYRHFGEYVATRWCDEGADWQSPMQGTPMAKPATCTKSEIKPGEPLPSYLGDPKGGPNPYPWPIPIIGENVATKSELVGHFDPRYPDFRLEFPDQLRVDEFLNEFNPWVAARKKCGASNPARADSAKGAFSKCDPMPQFIQLRLPNDHTSGTDVGKPTPEASVADNDLAVGRVVEAISNSPYWDDTAIFILEDDAQDGGDHVDAHRSTAYVISKYAPKPVVRIEFQGKVERRDTVPFIDSHFYTTVNLIHTMEVLLGLPPMNNNDAQAAIMAPLFSGDGTQPAFKADYRNRDNKLIFTANKAGAPGSMESSKMNFRHADQIDTALLNAIVWRERKGNLPVPAPKHTVIPERAGKQIADDDDD